MNIMENNLVNNDDKIERAVEVILTGKFTNFKEFSLQVFPDLGYEIRFVVEQVQVALFADSIDSVNALTNPSVFNPASVKNQFSAITYAKGASVLRMTQYLLGKATFEKGLRTYLQNR